MWPDVSGGLSIIPAPEHCHCPAMCCPRVWRDSVLGTGAGASTQRDQSVQGKQGKAGEFLGTDRLEVFG